LSAEGRQTQDARSVETADESATDSVFLFRPDVRTACGRLVLASQPRLARTTWFTTAAHPAPRPCWVVP